MREVCMKTETAAVQEAIARKRPRTSAGFQGDGGGADEGVSRFLMRAVKLEPSQVEFPISPRGAFPPPVWSYVAVVDNKEKAVPFC